MKIKLYSKSKTIFHIEKMNELFYILPYINKKLFFATIENFSSSRRKKIYLSFCWFCFYFELSKTIKKK